MRFSFGLVMISAVVVGGASARAQTVFAGAGSTNATAQRDSFRTAIGGGTTAGANGSFGGVRREINWDTVPANQSAPNNLPANFFNTTSPRGVVFSTPGTGFQVSGATTDSGGGQPVAANFGNIDASYTGTFAPFSAQRLFTPLGSNVLDVSFFVPGTSTPALVKGFGAVFSDADLAGSTIQFFDANNNPLNTFAVPASAGTQTISFLGVLYPTATVSRVRITCGNAALAAGVTENASRDLTVLDDFIYDEPSAAAPSPTPTATATATPTATATATPTATPTATATATATPTATTAPSATPTATPTATPPAKLLNMSSRARVLPNDGALIDGFILTGTENKSVAIRAIGPSLTSLGVPNALQDPVIELYHGATSVKTNDNWKTDDSTGFSQEFVIRQAGLAPSDDRESVILATLSPGSYTTVMRGKNNGTGNGVLEIYDLNSASLSKLANISGRAFVDLGDNALFAGFISGATMRIVARAIGPSLGASGINDALQDPTLDLFDGNGTPLMSNDNWRDNQETEIQNTGLAPSDPRESAITGIFPGGPYTAVVRGKNNAVGTAVVEIYQTQ